MSAADGRITAANVQAVADNIVPHAAALGLMTDAQHITVQPGQPGAGIPWRAWLAVREHPESVGGRITDRAEFLPMNLGSTAREAHATLTAAFVALREAAHADRERILQRGYRSVSVNDWQAFEVGEISARELQRRVNASKKG